VDTGEVEYLIRWLGADRDGNDFEDSWEPDYNVFGEELIEEFERMRAARRLQHRANKAGRLSVHSSPRVDGDDYGIQKLHPAPPRYHAQVPSSTSGNNKSTIHDHQQVPSLPTAGHPLHYPALSRPLRSLAPLPSYPATSQSLYSKPTPGRLPSSNIPTRDIPKTLQSTLPTTTSESAAVDTTEPMNVDGTDESLSHSDKRKRVRGLDFLYFIKICLHICIFDLFFLSPNLRALFLPRHCSFFPLFIRTQLFNWHKRVWWRIVDQSFDLSTWTLTLKDHISNP